jgi:hypothetical protein
MPVRMMVVERWDVTARNPDGVLTGDIVSSVREAHAKKVHDIHHC